MLSFVLLFTSWLVFHEATAQSSQGSRRPHVVFMMADDLGWNDVSWHNPGVIMPNLNKLAMEGVILNRSYVQPTCTPSRGSLLTGLYAHKTGLQHGPLGDLQPTGLPTDFTLLPQRLKEVGYKTHLVGKWHLGFCKEAYTPNHRGFDTFYGYLSGLESYDTHESYLMNNPEVNGLDFRFQDQVVYDQNGTYSTYSYANRVTTIINQHDRKDPLFLYYAFQTVHTPLQVPRRFFNMFANETDDTRRVYLGMIAAMDEGVGRLIDDLKRAHMYENTVFIFTSDNGGKRKYGGADNSPLPGYKDTLWEGGVRAPAFISGARVAVHGHIDTSLVHISDWMPTILDLAEYDLSKLNLDGMSIAKTIFKGKRSHRAGLVINIDELGGNAAIIEGRYKLIVGSPEYCREWYTPPYNRCAGRLKALQLIKKWLYDVVKDPTETKNLAKKLPRVTQRLLGRLQRHFDDIRPSVEVPNDLAGLPYLWGGVWSPGWC